MNRIVILFSLALIIGCKTEHKVVDAPKENPFSEKHRPQFHFSPPSGWMNDPNGMVYHNGEYHLFYQHYPDSTVWGPMHWGHSISNDLVHWKHLPIALYPDSLGYIFSGSAVVDSKNTSGFGTNDNPPLVAVFTYHSKAIENAGRSDFQYQGIAYSIDNGRKWVKYENNPVLKNQGIKDFRDPKVFWHEGTQMWVMILAVKDHTELWGSPDLKSWKKLSDFGLEYGAHGGVWECPDLIELKGDNNEEKWVLIVSLNPGGPNGGSATQYFTGSFDGVTFKPDTEKNITKWLDYGPDNYAGITWSNAPDSRKVFLGWMSNWAYADRVPTSTWRSAATLPRDLALVKLNDSWHIQSTLSKEILSHVTERKSFPLEMVNNKINLSEQGISDAAKSIITGAFDDKKFSIVLSNSKEEELKVGYDADKKLFFIDRSKAGRNSFADNFVSYLTAPRISTDPKINFTMVTDVSSVEVFFDDGISVMTALYFPDEVLTDVSVEAPNGVEVENLNIGKINSIWKDEQEINN